MAKPVVLIQFPSPASPELMGRVLNFIEDVDRIARDEALGSIADIDHYASGIFTAHVSSSRRLGEMLALLSKRLEHHMLKTEAIVSRADRGGQS